MRTLDQIPLNRLGGLEADASICIGSGFVREEWKSLCFKSGIAIDDRAILNEKQLAERFVPESSGRVLENSARIELLRQLFRETSVRDVLPILSQHRYRPKFFEGVDRSLQQGRMLFAHAEEAAVLQERLNEKLGIDLKREEFFTLNQLWEKVLKLKNFWDEARLLEDATQRLDPISVAQNWKRSLIKLQHFKDLPRARLFWERFSEQHSITTIPSDHFIPPKDQILFTRHRSHSLEDAAHYLLDTLVQAHEADPEAFQHHLIVIQDEPSVRRTLKRVAQQRGVPLQDPRDPTLLVQSEEIKTALIELSVVARGFSSAAVLSWLSTQPSLKPQLGEIRKKIIENGLTQGFEAYQFIPELKSPLHELSQRYPVRLSLPELHLSLKKTIRALALPVWVDAVFDRMFSSWIRSFELLGIANRKKPLRYWLEQVQDKLRKATPIANPLKNERGLRLFRVDQAVSALEIEPNPKRVIHFFGVTPSYFEPREEGNEWFSTRDREVLANEFGLVSYRDLQAQALHSFTSWASVSGADPIFWEYEYDSEGSECESCELNLSSIQNIQLKEPMMLGAHPRWLPSLRAELRSLPEEVRVPLTKLEWPVSFMNAYGNCAFTAYAGFLLSLYDEREADFELKGDSFGNLVHSALEKVLKENLSAELAFESAWKQTRQLAWLKSDRLYRAIRHKTLRVLDSFVESEREYRQNSKAETAAIERPIEWVKNGLKFSGRIDRVDQHADGLIVIDYKTSSSNRSGAETLEKGAGLQLPLYALALKEKENQEVIAAQYLQLSPDKVNRNLGFLFSKWNRSKKSDVVEFPISNARSISKSLFQEDPEVIWTQIDAKLTQLIQAAKEGQFSPKPARPQDCPSCRYLGICGKLRARNSTENLEADDADLSGAL